MKRKVVQLIVPLLILLLAQPTLAQSGKKGVFGGMGGKSSGMSGKKSGQKSCMGGKRMGAGAAAATTAVAAESDSEIDPIVDSGLKAFSPALAEKPVMETKGFVDTGLKPVYPAGFDCPKVTSSFASPTRTDGSRRSKRFFFGRHGGMDIPQPKGTPLLAMADGEVIHVHKGSEDGIGGYGIWLRHSPEQIGGKHWVFLEYKHIDQIPDLKHGDRVKMGQEIALTGNTGTTGGYYGKEGFYHLHMTAYWGDSAEYKFKKVLLPEQGNWLDPVALFHSSSVLDSVKLAQMSDKQAAIAFIDQAGKRYPESARVVWPYACTAK